MERRKIFPSPMVRHDDRKFLRVAEDRLRTPLRSVQHAEQRQVQITSAGE